MSVSDVKSYLIGSQ